MEEPEMKKHPLLLRSADIQQMRGRLKTHFLNPNAVRLSRSLGDAVGLSRIGVHWVEVEPGRDSSEYHMHYQEEECVFVLAGQGTACIDGEDYPVAAGDFLGLPRGRAAHNIRNTGDERLVLLVMGQRLEQDVADYPDRGKRIYRSAAGWDLVDIEEIESITPTLPRPEIQ
jgi:uncharacterized cupin superfamily protein